MNKQLQVQIHQIAIYFDKKVLKFACSLADHYSKKFYDMDGYIQYQNIHENDEASTLRQRNLPELASNGPDHDINLKKGVQEPILDAKSAIQQNASGVTRSLPKSSVTSSENTEVLKGEADKPKDLIEYSSHWLTWPIFVLAIVMILYGWFKIFQFMKR